MDRLTIYDENDKKYCRKSSHVTNARLCEKLGALEDLEEQCKLLKLPCRVGDLVYVIENKFIRRKYISRISMTLSYSKAQTEMIFYCADCYHFRIEQIGKNVFLTLEDAKNKLERRHKRKE